MKTSASPTFLSNVNSALNELKLEFHRTGRYDDSNTKLDEITKLLVIKFMDARNGRNSLDLKNLEHKAKKDYGDPSKIAKALIDTFTIVAADPIFINSDGTNIFGANPSLNIQPSDNLFAERILSILSTIDLNHGTNLDLLNETFGHFIRDNFRNHKEDAQYMTPAEVVEAMSDIALEDILNDPISRERLFSKEQDSFYVLDPTCGVGSFVISAYRKIVNAINNAGVQDAEDIISARKDHSFLGQDKVDRMVRLSKINALFYDLNPNLFEQGNSILGDSYIDQFEGKIDLILTNPPFGANFTTRELFGSERKFSLLKELDSITNINSIDSELIMLERSLELLRPGGRLLIVVPDGVVSAKGTFETYRKMLPSNFDLKAVIDLPAVTFAQAGTRTRCSIVYIQKPYKKPKQQNVFMAVAENIGYEVKQRSGAPVKIESGKDQLIDIVKSYVTTDHSRRDVVSISPSAVWYPFDEIINDKWNANFYRADRLNIIAKFEQITEGDFEIKSLEELVSFETKARRTQAVSKNVKHISVLHIGEDSIINVDEVIRYSPIGAGVECEPNDIILAKINPRIPRIAVLPKFDFRTTCSREFEIMRAKNETEAYLIKTLLLSEIVQKQINSLTSGTSSSHNRIKSAELMSIQIPWPKTGSKTYKKMLLQAESIQEAEEMKYEATEIVREARTKIGKLINL